MLLLQRASTRRRSGGRIGLAVAGGGPIGGMYELGALCALDEAIEGLYLTDLEVYVGVSSGAFLAAALANGIDTRQMRRILVAGGSDSEAPFRPENFLRPAVGEYVRRAAGVPQMLWDWWREWLRHPGEAGLGDLLGRFGGLVPTGLFDNEGIERFLRSAFTRKGRVNDFRELPRPLFVVAVDLDSGEVVRFGADGWDDVPISRAVQASAALPGLYTPVRIRGRNFVDGALRRTMHASVAMDHGIDLLIGLNPLVPYDAGRAEPGVARGSLMQGGLPMVLSQTFRTLLQSRMQVGFAKYESEYPHVDQLILEPDPDDAEMFFTNVFGYASRRRVVEHAYRSTLKDLAARTTQLQQVLERHGLTLRQEVLADPQRRMLAGMGRPRGSTEATARLERTLDQLEHTIAAPHLRGGTRHRR
ncbi:MAG TPA: patatin-like phospholipase family protein [Xanthomonadaceae bacterium]|nr:patatin-like phospholipase family protein [Xanthomonadaceae bacterium]